MTIPHLIDDEKVARLTAAGWTAKEISRELGFTTRTVERARARAGVAQPPPRRFTPEELALAQVLLEDGASLSEVARSIGCHPTTVHRRFRGMGFGWSPQQTGAYNRLRSMRETLL